MWGALRFLILVTVLALAAVWFADNPGEVSLNWQGYRVDTSVGLLVAAVAAIAVVTAALYRGWLFLRRAPRSIGRVRQEGRRRKGYMALTRGMVAVAAGDGEEAERHSRRADVLLNEPPLTLLLSAQSAQLNGDDGAAERFFKAMLDQPDTEFLGVRGLLAQAMKRQDWEEALKLARRAHRLRPKSEWVESNLLELQTRTEHWAAALETLDQSVRNKHVSNAESRRHRAVLEHQWSIEARAAGELSQAVRHARKAYDLDPTLVPGVSHLARLYLAQGKVRKAAQLLEAAWAGEPHPDYVEPYWEAKGAGDALTRVKVLGRLIGGNQDHLESHLAMARAALDARLWGEARAHLVAVTGSAPTARVCRMMAELEEAEHGDLAAARSWLVRAAHAESDPLWVCTSCGNSVADWSAHCANCGSFDSFSWRTVPHVSGLAAVTGTELVTVSEPEQPPSTG